MNLALVISRKHNWSEDCFYIWFSENSWKVTTNQLSVSKIFFANINISFFDLCSEFFSVTAKKVNQIRNNVVCFVACLIFVFCYALTTGRCNAFQPISVNQKNSVFYNPHFQTMLFLVTMFWQSKLEVLIKN